MFACIIVDILVWCKYMPEDFSVFPSAIVTVDVVLFAIAEGHLQVLLPKRGSVPFFGARALPGGYLRVQSDVDAFDSARRVLATKANLISGYALEQLAVFSGIARDPRGWSLSVAFYAVARAESVAFDDFVDVDALPSLPFDHGEVVRAAIARMRGGSGLSALPAFMLPGEFTIRDFQEVYESVMGRAVDSSSLRRRIEDAEMLVPVEGKFRDAPHGRPAQLYRLSDAVVRRYAGGVL